MISTFSSGIRSDTGCGFRRAFISVLLGFLVVFVSGCDTPYTKRVRQLDEAYQNGYLSREDYMRFVHEEEQWNRGPTTEVLWSK